MTTNFITWSFSTHRPVFELYRSHKYYTEQNCHHHTYIYTTIHTYHHTYAPQILNQKKLGISTYYARKCALKMHVDAINHLHSIVKTRRHLEPKTPPNDNKPRPSLRHQRGSHCKLPWASAHNYVVSHGDRVALPPWGSLFRPSSYSLNTTPSLFSSSVALTQVTCRPRFMSSLIQVHSGRCKHTVCFGAILCKIYWDSCRFEYLPSFAALFDQYQTTVPRYTSTKEPYAD